MSAGESLPRYKSLHPPLRVSICTIGRANSVSINKSHSSHPRDLTLFQTWEETPSWSHGGRNPHSQLAALRDPSSRGWRGSPGAAAGIPPPPPAAPALPQLSEQLRWHNRCHNRCHSPECGCWQLVAEPGRLGHGWSRRLDCSSIPVAIPGQTSSFSNSQKLPGAPAGLWQRTKPRLCPGNGSGPAAGAGSGWGGWEVTLGVAECSLSTVPTRENAGRTGFKDS